MTLILFALVVVNMAGHGITGGVVALVWIIFGLGLLWNLMYFVFYHALVDFLLVLPIVVLSIITYALAFRNRE